MVVGGVNGVNDTDDRVMKKSIYELARSTARKYSSFASVMAVSNASRRCACIGNQQREKKKKGDTVEQGVTSEGEKKGIRAS